MSEIIIVASIDVKPEARQAMLDILAPLVEASRKEAGNISYNLHQGIKNANALTIIECWKSQQAIDEHNATPHFQKFLAESKDKMANLDIKLMTKL